MDNYYIYQPIRPQLQLNHPFKPLFLLPSLFPIKILIRGRGCLIFDICFYFSAEANPKFSYFILFLRQKLSAVLCFSLIFLLFLPRRSQIQKMATPASSTPDKKKTSPPPKRGQIKARIFEDIFKSLVFKVPKTGESTGKITESSSPPPSAYNK